VEPRLRVRIRARLRPRCLYGPILQEAILKELGDAGATPEETLQAMRERFSEFGIHTIGDPGVGTMSEE
jgi:hypothetical protein